MKLSRTHRLLGAAIVLLLSTIYSSWQHGYLSGGTSNDGSFAVARVVDGDTIIVHEGLKDETIRLLGINTPETVDPRKTVQCFGKNASAKMHELLDGKRVILISAEGREDRDKYNRQLRYVQLVDGTDINLFMIANGFAHEYTYGSPHPRTPEYRAAQAKAKADKIGMWADSACAQESATRPPKH